MNMEMFVGIPWSAAVVRELPATGVFPEPDAPVAKAVQDLMELAKIPQELVDKPKAASDRSIVTAGEPMFEETVDEKRWLRRPFLSRRHCRQA